MKLAPTFRQIARAFLATSIGTVCLLLAGCIYTESAEEAATAFINESLAAAPEPSPPGAKGIVLDPALFKRLAQENTYLDDKHSEKVSDSVRAAFWLSHCGDVTDIRFTQLSADDKSASFSVELANSAGDTFSVPRLDMVKDKFRWWVSAVQDTTEVQEVVVGVATPSYSRPGASSSKEDESGPMVFNPKQGKETSAYRVRFGAKGVCMVSSAQRAKLGAEADAKKAEFLKQALDAAELYKQQKALDEMKSNFAQETTTASEIESVEAKKNLLNRLRATGAAEVTTLINEYLKALSTQDLAKAGTIWDGADTRASREVRIFRDCGGIEALRAAPPQFVPARQADKVGHMLAEVDVALRSTSARECDAYTFSQSQPGGYRRMTFKLELAGNGRWREVQ